MRDYPTLEIFEDDFPNVKGTGFGPNDELIVFVSKKVPEDELDVDDIIPTSVVIDGESYITDVDPVGIPHGQDAPMAETEPADHQSRHRPLVGGISIGNSEGGAGTLGHCELEHVASGDIVGLTNSHVSGGSDKQYQPAEMDGGNENTPIGTLREASDLDPSETQTTDSALIDVDPDQVSAEILGIGELAGFGDISPTFEYTYKKSGRTTGVTSGDMRGRDASIRVAYGEKTIRVSGCAVFSRMSAPGDSGSLIGVETEDDGFHATHLLFAGSSEATIAVPLSAVQAEHGELTVPGADENGGDEAPVTWGEFRYSARPAGGSAAGAVVDGDTYDVDFSLGFDIRKTDQRIRLLGIDTAERGTDDYDTHTQFAVDWLAEAAAEHDGEWPLVVETHEDKTGSFGRWLVTIQRKSDGEWIGDAFTNEFGEDVRYEVTEQLERLLQ